MPEIKLNISIPKGEWIDAYQKSNISVGTKVSIDNIGSSDIYYTSVFDQPAIDFRGYNTLKPRVGKVSNDTGDPGLWILSLSEKAEINVGVFVDEHIDSSNELIKLLVKLITTTHENQEDILNQLKLINLNLSEMGGNSFDKNDLEE